VFENVFERVGIGRSIGANVVDATKEFTIKVKAAPPPPPEEGKGAIVAIEAPTEFTPGDAIHIKIYVMNSGATDDIFVRFMNKDTGYLIRQATATVNAGANFNPYPIDVAIQLTQTTDFHGVVEVGHVI